MKLLLAVCLIAIPLHVSADGWGGAMMGIGQAGTTYGNQREAERREARQEQYDIAREKRIQDAMLEQRQQQAEYDRQDAIRQKAYQDEAKAKSTELYHKKQLEILSMHHPDWEGIISSKGFDDWKLILPTEVKHTIDSTWDGEYISSAITAFKEYQAKNKKHTSKRIHT